MNASWFERLPVLGQNQLRADAALKTRPNLSFIETSGGRVRVRHHGSESGPRLLFAADGPNVVEHYDELLRVFDGRADIVIFEPPGTGASVPSGAFDFSFERLEAVCTEVLQHFGPRTLVFPCYLGFVGQVLARNHPSLVKALVTPQTPSWSDMLAWADGVDARRLVRTPVVGQLFVSLNRARVAKGWYAASTGDRSFRAPFMAAANEAFAVGGCFCLASLMQGLERAVPRPGTAVPCRAALVWGPRDRTHRRSQPARGLEGAELVQFDECGHSPELEQPQRFTTWLMKWLEASHG